MGHGIATVDSLVQNALIFPSSSGLLQPETHPKVTRRNVRGGAFVRMEFRLSFPFIKVWGFFMASSDHTFRLFPCSDRGLGFLFCC